MTNTEKLQTLRDNQAWRLITPSNALRRCKVCGVNMDEDCFGDDL